MKIKYCSLLGLAVIPMVAGCASTPLALSPVGPGPGRPAPSASAGRLQVFSATQQSNPIGDIGPASYSYPHTGYDINDASGQRVEFVANHFSDMDESPDVVKLSAGHYQIVAESSCFGLVTVPVVIENGKTTVVHLDRNWWPPRHTAVDRVVWLPDGEGVGWSGAIATSP
jgi:hypothetical protein